MPHSAAGDRPEQLLLLFDIDGTLMRGAALAQARAMFTAIEQVYGVSGIEQLDVPAAGRTDLEIARDYLRRHGLEDQAVTDQLSELSDLWIKLHDQSVADLSDKVIAGIPQLLTELSADDRFKLSLVTGNLEPIAHAKLHHAGIGSYFVRGQGGFGSDHEERSYLPPIARQRASKDGEEWPRQRTVLIGDTPRDIACARADQVECIAVTSGPYTAEQLREADHIAEGSEQLYQLITELG